VFDHHFLADGFHRYYGARAAGHFDIAVELFEGDVREATRYACGANARHAVPRTREDKWFEVAAFLCESELAGATDAEIAKACRVSRQMIAKVRPHATSKDDFDQYMKDEAERRTLAREDREIARKKAKAEAKAAPRAAPTLPVPDRPLTPQEEAMAALARAAEAAGLARKAMAECGRAYPEAQRFEALMAICEAQCQIDELVPPIATPTSPDASPQQMLSFLKECRVDLQAQPEKLHGSHQPEKLHAAEQAAIPTRSVSEAGPSQPSLPSLGVDQPEKLHASFPAPSHSWGGLGRGAEALSSPANSKSFNAGLQPEKLRGSHQPEKFHCGMLQPEKLHAAEQAAIPTRSVSEASPSQPSLPSLGADQPEKLHASFPAPSHSWGGLGRGAEALSSPANSKSFNAGLQPEKLHPSPNHKSSRRSRRRDKKRHRDRPTSSRSPPVD